MFEMGGSTIGMLGPAEDVMVTMYETDGVPEGVIVTTLVSGGGTLYPLDALRVGVAGGPDELEGPGVTMGSVG